MKIISKLDSAMIHRFDASDAGLTGDQVVASPIPIWVRQHSSVIIDHKLFAMVILSFSLIQEWRLSVSGERMCANTG